MIICPTKALRILIWLGVLHAAIWAVMMIRPLPVIAQRATEQRLTRAEDAVMDLRILIEHVQGRLSSITGEQARQASSIDRLDAKVQRFLEGLVGLFVAIAGALLTVLWSLRKGWLTVRP